MSLFAQALAGSPRLWLAVLLCAHPVWTSVEILLDASLASNSLVNGLLAATTRAAATAPPPPPLFISLPSPMIIMPTQVSIAQLVIFFLLLICAAAAVELFVRRPMAQLMLPLLDLAGKHGLADKETATWEKLVGCELS
jgi:hypothetical protein